MTYISRKEILDLLNRLRKEEVCNQREESLINLVAQEILHLPTYEITKEDKGEEQWLENHSSYLRQFLQSLPQFMQYILPLKSTKLKK